MLIPSFQEVYAFTSENFHMSSKRYTYIGFHGGFLLFNFIILNVYLIYIYDILTDHQASQREF